MMWTETMHLTKSKVELRMKKNIFSIVSLLAVAAVTLCLASCSDDDKFGTVVYQSLEFTATIAGDGATRTTIDATDGKVSWETTDEITITDAGNQSAGYKVKSIDAETGMATFVYSSGEVLGAGPYTATYGKAPETGQTYSATVGQLPMSAESETTSLLFTVTCGLLKLNINSDAYLQSIAVTGTPAGGDEATYTLTCTTPQAIKYAQDFYISLPAGKYTKIVFKDDNDLICTKTAKSEIEIEAGHIKPITFSTALVFAAPPTTGSAPVTDNTDITHITSADWVQLWKDGPKWATFNVGCSEVESYGSTYAQYYWGSTDDRTCSSSTEDIAGGSNDTARNLWGDNWRMPSKEDFQNLISDTYTECKWDITYPSPGVSVYGLIVKGKSGTAYQNNEVFFPACGFLHGSRLTEEGNYWSSTPIEDYGAWYLTFNYADDSDFQTVWKGSSRASAYSVRAILAE